MHQHGSCYWQEYFGDFITATGQRTYIPTQDAYNYCGTSRTFTSATTNHVTVSPKNAVSWDDTWNLTKLTATGSSPRIAISSVSSSALSAAVCTGSIWVAADATHPPDTSTNSANVTMTLTDGASAQAVSHTIAPGTTPDRYALSSYFTNASSSLILTLSWTSATGVIYIDACQFEASPYATEYIDNTGTSALERTLFADPSRIVSFSQYYPNTTATYNDLVYYDSSLYPNERAYRPDTASFRSMSNQGGYFNLENVPAGTHMMYRAKAIPKKLLGTSGETIPALPEPWTWVVVQGAKAFVQSSMYDIGANNDSSLGVKAFDDLIEATLEMSDPSPNYTWIHNNYPRMRTF